MIFSYDHSLQANSIYIRTLTYDTSWHNVFIYPENSIERLFPDETTSHTIKLEQGEHVYYTSTDSLEELKLLVVSCERNCCWMEESDPKSGQMQIEYDINEVNVVYQDSNSIIMFNDGMNNNVIDIINQPNEVSYFASKYEKKVNHP